MLGVASVDIAAAAATRGGEHHSGHPTREHSDKAHRAEATPGTTHTLLWNTTPMFAASCSCSLSSQRRDATVPYLPEDPESVEATRADRAGMIRRL